MDAASGAKRSGLVAAVLAAVAVLVAWAFFAGGASGTSATAPLGTVAVLVAAALVVGCSRGHVALPRLDRAGTVAVAAAIGLVAWTGLSIWWSIAGDRSWDALANGIVLLAFGVVGLAVGALPGRPLRSLALLLAAAFGAVLVWALLGKAIPALGPDDAGRVARLKGSIGYWNALALLADAALGARSLAARLGSRALRPPVRRVAPLRGHDRDPADPVARRAHCRCGRRRSGAPAVRTPRRGRAARAARNRPGGRRHGLGVHAARRSSRTVARGRIASPMVVCSAS